MRKSQLFLSKFDNALMMEIHEYLTAIGISKKDDISIIEVGNYKGKDDKSDTDLFIFLNNSIHYKGIESIRGGIIRMQIQLRTFSDLKSLSHQISSWEKLSDAYLIINGRIIHDNTGLLKTSILDLKKIFYDDETYFGLIFQRLNYCVQAISKYQTKEFSISRNVVKAYISHEIIVSCLAMRRHVYPGPSRVEYLLAFEEFNDLSKYCNNINRYTDTDFIQVTNILLRTYGVFQLLEAGKEFVKIFET